MRHVRIQTDATGFAMRISPNFFKYRTRPFIGRVRFFININLLTELSPMKHSIIILTLLVCPLILSATTSWQRLDANLEKVRYFPKCQQVVAFGENGCLLRSLDKGRTWEQPNSRTLKRITSIDFATPSIAVAVGDSGLVIRSTDSGRTWRSVASPTQNLLQSIQFVTPFIGFAGGENSTLFKTTDAGSTWQKIPAPDSCNILALSMNNPLSGIIAGSRSSIWNTSDGGEHWNRIFIQNMPAGDYNFRQCLREPNGKLYIYGFDYQTDSAVLVTSENGGAFVAHYVPTALDITLQNDTLYLTSPKFGTLQSHVSTYDFSYVPIGDSHYPPMTQSIMSLCFADSINSVAVGFDKLIYHSSTTGVNWNLRSYCRMTSTEPVTSIFFVDDTTGYVCGAVRFIYRTKNGGITWLPQEQNAAGGITVPYTLYVCFTSPTTGFGASNSNPYSFIKTTDGGASYTGSYFLTGFYPKVYFLNSTNGICVNNIMLKDNTNLGVLHATKDGGASWKTTFFGAGLWTAHYRNESTILMAGPKRDESLKAKFRSFAYLTHDGGTSWDSVAIPFSASVRDCWMVNDSLIYLSGATQTDYRSYWLLHRSTNGGKSFEIYDSTSSTSVVTIRFIDEKYGYMLYSDKVVRTLDGGNVWSKVEQPTEFSGEAFTAMSVLPSGNIVIGTLSNALYRSSFDTSELVRVEEPPKDDASGAAPVWIRNPVPTPSNEVVRAEVLWLPSITEDEITFDFLNLLGQKPSTPVSIRLTRGAPPVGAEGYRGGTVEVHPPANLPSGMYLLAIRAKGFSKAVPVIIAR